MLLNKIPNEIILKILQQHPEIINLIFTCKHFYQLSQTYKSKLYFINNLGYSVPIYEIPIKYIYIKTFLEIKRVTTLETFKNILSFNFDNRYYENQVFVINRRNYHKINWIEPFCNQNIRNGDILEVLLY